MENKDLFDLTTPVDFAVILKHLKQRFLQKNAENESSRSDVMELVSALFEDLKNICKVKPSVENYEIETTGFIYAMVWLESYSLTVCSDKHLDTKQTFEKAILLSNDKIELIKASVEHENVPSVSTFNMVVRLYDAYHERLIDSEKLIRFIENSGKEDFKYFLDKLECTTRTFRYLDWSYFNKNYSYA